MSFSGRLRRLLTADAHGVLDALEDRRLSLRQALREAEAADAARSARLEALETERRELGDEISALERTCESADRDVELALEQDRDDLARFAAARLLPARQALERARERRAALDETAAAEREAARARATDLDELRGRVRDELQRLERDVEAERADDGGSGSGSGAATSNEEVELELLRRRVAKEAS